MLPAPRHGTTHTLVEADSWSETEDRRRPGRVRHAPAGVLEPARVVRLVRYELDRGSRAGHLTDDVCELEDAHLVGRTDVEDLAERLLPRAAPHRSLDCVGDVRE